MIEVADSVVKMLWSFSPNYHIKKLNILAGVPVRDFTFIAAEFHYSQRTDSHEILAFEKVRNYMIDDKIRNNMTSKLTKRRGEGDARNEEFTILILS